MGGGGHTHCPDYRKISKSQRKLSGCSPWAEDLGTEEDGARPLAGVPIPCCALLGWLRTHRGGRNIHPKLPDYLQGASEQLREGRHTTCILKWRWQLTTKIRHFYNAFIEVLMNK